MRQNNVDVVLHFRHEATSSDNYVLPSERPSSMKIRAFLNEIKTLHILKMSLTN